MPRPSGTSFDGETAQAPAGSYAQPGSGILDRGPQVQNNSVSLSPEVKQMVSEEVQAQLAAEQAAATQGSAPNAAPTSLPQQGSGNTEQAPAAPIPTFEISIVASTLDVKANNQDCSLSACECLCAQRTLRTITIWWA